MSAATRRLAPAVAGVLILVVALFFAPALGSDRMPPAALSVGIAVLAMVLAGVAVLSPALLRPLGGPAGSAAIAFTTLPVLAYAAFVVSVSHGRVGDYHFSDGPQVSAVVAFHCLIALTWLAAVWSQDADDAREPAAGLWTMAVLVALAATATAWLTGEFVDRVTGAAAATLLIAYFVAQPLAVLVAALYSRVGNVARVFAPLTTIAVGLAVNFALLIWALSEAFSEG